ncbi:MAG: tetratricopeptide repeat protein [Bacteroidetes bacterium]|nr:MAG: tetratricopeptide repeat protein [Bacteroidota bacterium]
MSKTKVPHRKKPAEAKIPKDNAFLVSIGWIALLSLGTWMLYSSSLKFDILNWDEKHYIYEQSMTLGVSWENIQAMFSKKVLGSYNPLVLVSFAIDHDLSDSKASWYHGVNVFFHILNTLLLFAVVRKLGFRPLIAGFVALLFAIHPMHIESVAWIASRKDVLMGFFMFSSWLIYLQFRKTKKWYTYAFSILLFLFALLSKAQAVTLPLIFILSDYLQDKTWTWKALYNKIPFLILSLIIGYVAVSGSTFSADKYAIPLSFIDKISYSLIALWVYIYKAILPIQQSAIYAFPEKGSQQFILQLIISTLLVIGAAWLIVKNFRARPLIAFALLFFLMNTFLTLHIVAVNSSLIYERFAYLSYIGLFFLVALPLGNEKFKKQAPWFFAGVCILFAYLTSQRLPVWKNSIALWTDTIEKNPSSSEAYNNRGDYYNSAGVLDKAFEDFTNSTKVNTKQPNAFNNLAVIWFKRNDLDKALVENQKALDLDPEYAQATSNRGILYFNKGQMDSAKFYYRKAIGLLPNYAFAICNLGSVYLKEEKPDSAIMYYKQALAIQTQYHDASKYLGLAYLKKQAFDDAEQAMYNAQKMSKTSDALQVLSSEYVILASKAFHNDEKDKAILLCERAIKANPQNAEAYYNLGGYYMTLQNLTKTRENWKKALQINPNYKEAKEWLERIGG